MASNGGGNELAVPASIAEIAPFLCVADEVEPINPRIAYLCRFNAIEKSHRLDPTSSGQGVRQFKTALLKRLQRDNLPTLLRREKRSDARELQSFYQYYFQKYIQPLENAAEPDYAKITKAYQTTSVLFEVLKIVSLAESMEVNSEILEAQDKVAENMQICVSSNILPPDSDIENQNQLAIVTAGEQRMEAEEATDGNQGAMILYQECEFEPRTPPSPSFEDARSTWDHFSPSSDGQNEKK